MRSRRLSLDDMEAAARVHRAAFDERLPWLAGLHTPEEDIAYFHGPVFQSSELWGTFEANQLVGILALRGNWIDQLYVLPERQGAGAGTMLLSIAKGRSNILQLWTFQRNVSARAFYEAHGFLRRLERDGQENEEGEPDVLYEWRLEGPVSSKV